MAEAWRSRAFGLEIEGDFPAPGLPPLPPGDGPLTRVRLGAVGEDWDGAERLLDELGGARTIDHLPGRGYRLYARHFGLASISEDGGEVVCAPPDDEPWSWQRFLVGRILPWAAVLRGREVFHAGAVALGDGALAFVGPTGSGKTSLVATLIGEGARFVTDDVLAVDGALRAHPGAALSAVRPAERRLAGVGRVLGESEKIYVEVDRIHEPLPLRALYFIVAGDDAGVDPVPSPDPRALLGSTFNRSVRTPDRLARQFNLCADIGERVPLFALRRGADAGSMAAAVLEHVRSPA